ncbi:MAG: NAD(P)/FAD-dependent oxidoreductase, partial [Planctomycetes bacterium]|nr:NAD(P)/FAD-dependent oxidoreductase [Planctomycetota bacterium]
KHKKLQSTGALIFTDRGIAGPVVKDFAREVTPLLAKYDTVPLLGNLVQGRHSEECLQALKKKQKELVGGTCEDVFSVLIPAPVFAAACAAIKCESQSKYSELAGAKRDALINWLIACPFTVVGSSGFRQAMVTRGGVTLKQINPHTLASKQIKGLHFCGEAVDLDGPCGGFNLTWAWASGRLAGMQWDG